MHNFKTLFYALFLPVTCAITTAAPLPAELTALIREVDTGKTDYPERASDVRGMQSYIASGDFEMAAFKAKNIIDQQNNLRLCGASAVFCLQLIPLQHQFIPTDEE